MNPQIEIVISFHHQRLQRLPQARPEQANTIGGIEQRTVGKTDDVTAITRHEAVLAVLHGDVEVRAKIAVSLHLTLPQQPDDRVAPLLPRIKATGLTLEQLLSVAKKCGHGWLLASGEQKSGTAGSAALRIK